MMISKVLNVHVPVAEVPLREIGSYLQTPRITRHITLQPDLPARSGGQPVEAVTHPGWGRGYAHMKRVGVAGIAIVAATAYGYIGAQLALDTFWLGLAAGAVGGVVGTVGWALRRNVTPVSGAITAYSVTTRAVGVPVRAFLRGVAVACGGMLDGATWAVGKSATVADSLQRKLSRSGHRADAQRPAAEPATGPLIPVSGLA